MIFRGAMAKTKLYHIAARRRNRIATRLDLSISLQPRVATLLPVIYCRLASQLMEGLCMLYDWNTYQAELSKAIPEFAKLSADSLKGYQTLSAANAKTSLLGEKVRQLISIAVAVTTRCDGCITFHTDAALKAGATKQEIAEALGVAMAMNAGAALIYSLRALDSVDAHSSKP